MRRSVVIVVVVCAAALLAPATAAADADPASDILLTANVFYPYSSPVSASLQKTLNAETTRAHRAGFPIKVALIERPLDLGGVFQLFAKPKPYAKFLDTEISFRTLQPVLVVMPAGLGGSGLGKATPTLPALPSPATSQPDALAQAAIAAIPKLAAAAGHPISTTAAISTGGGPSAAPIIGVAIALVVIALALVTLRDRRRRAGR